MPRQKDERLTPILYADNTEPIIPEPSTWSKDESVVDDFEEPSIPPLVASPPPHFLFISENKHPEANFKFPQPERIMRFGIKRGDYPISKIKWRTRTTMPRFWSNWFNQQEKIVSNITHLKAANIYHAVRQTTHNGPTRDKASLNMLGSRWSDETHTFMASWGEFAPSLEDVSHLLHLPLFGEYDITDISLNTEEKETVKHLTNSLRYCHQGTSSKRPNYSLWVTYFYGSIVKGSYSPGEANDKEYCFAAFLAMWLDIYVFPGPPFWGMSKRVFPLAVRLAQGKLYPLAGAYLGTLYKRLDLLGYHVRRSYSRCDVSCYADANFLQLFLYEHFPSYAGDVNLKEGYRSWAFEKSHAGCTLHSVIDKQNDFNFRPYTIYPTWAHQALLPYEDFNKVVSEIEHQQGYAKETSFLMIARPFYLVAFLEKTDINTYNLTTEVYNPHRFSRQFGYDQGGFSTIQNKCTIKEISEDFLWTGARDSPWILRPLDILCSSIASYRWYFQVGSHVSPINSS